MYISRFVIIKALTNMHVGSGERNFSVVDKNVQRDEITQIPVIQASSLKGALREHAEREKGAVGLSDSQIDLIFGKGCTSGSDINSTAAGEVRFFQADLIGLPVRATNRPYYLAATKEMLQESIDLGKSLGVNLGLSLPKMDLEPGFAYVEENTTNNLFIEDFPCKRLEGLENLEKFFDPGLRTRVVLFADATFKSISSILPVIARNKIGEDGTSENLFYEEIIPRQSRFGFFMSFPAGDSMDPQERKEVETGFDVLLRLITEGPLQVGANASVGYGVTEMKVFKDEK